ncbi:MAG: sulfotransferase [Candidatus Thiodiazotropha sp.]
MKKIFLIGSERSGTNLLRALLGNHSAISAPPPIHLCDLLYHRKHLWNINETTHLHKLVEQLNQYVNHEFSNWDLSIDAKQFIEKYSPTSILDLFNGIYSEKATADGKSAYFCKDNHIQKYACGIRNRFSDAKFIYIYRDPRDQAASWMKNTFFIRTPYAAARKWVVDQHECLALPSFYGIEVLPVKYEDLITSPDAVMSNLLISLDLNVDSACFQTTGNNKEADNYKLWENINKPIMRTNKKKYLSVLSQQDIKIVETVCRDHMDELGYAMDTTANYDFGNMYIWRLRDFVKGRLKKRSGDIKVISNRNKFISDVFSK